MERESQFWFFDDVCLYEDELGDNGACKLNVKMTSNAQRVLYSFANVSKSWWSHPQTPLHPHTSSVLYKVSIERVPYKTEHRKRV